MPNKCWAPRCKSNYNPNDAYSPVFKSPEDPQIRQSWLNVLHKEHVNPPNILYVCIKHFLKQDIDYTFRINDGLEIKYLKRDRALLVKGAIPPLLPGCPSYLSSTKTSRASRFSHEAKEEELFIIARILSLETQDAEGKKFNLDCFSDLKEKIYFSYPDPWLVWLQEDMINFIYPSKSVGVIRVEAALTIDSTLTARGFFQSKVISLGIDCISDVRQIETLLTELVGTISRSSKKISQPRDMIDEATALLQNAISCIEDHSKEDIDYKSNDVPFLPSLQFILSNSEIYAFRRISADIILLLKLLRLICH